jgi:hypothetical protein
MQECRFRTAMNDIKVAGVRLLLEDLHRNRAYCLPGMFRLTSNFVHTLGSALILKDTTKALIGEHRALTL